MPTRTQRTTITFDHPFLLKRMDRILPPGNYVVVTDEELVEGLSFSVYRRVSTTEFLPLRAARGCSSRRAARSIQRV
jgi:hypothetical protein